MVDLREHQSGRRREDNASKYRDPGVRRAWVESESIMVVEMGEASGDGTNSKKEVSHL